MALQTTGPYQPPTAADHVDARPEWGPARTKSITWWDPAATVAGGAGMSGLEFIRALRDQTIPPPPIAILLGMRPVTAEPGLVVFKCTPDETVYNPIGIVHGGLVCTLADSVIGCAVHTTLDAGTGYTSIAITVNYLRPVTVDSGTLTATGKVKRAGRRVALAEAEIHDSAGKTVASGTSNCLIIPPS